MNDKIEKTSSLAMTSSVNLTRKLTIHILSSNVRSMFLIILGICYMAAPQKGSRNGELSSLFCLPDGLTQISMDLKKALAKQLIL